MNYRLLARTGLLMVMSFVGISFPLHGAENLPDVGMVTRLTGAAMYWNDAAQPAKSEVKSFMKIRMNDRFRLEAASEVQLVYFATGKKELWKGPVTLVFGKDGGQTEGTDASVKPVISEVPAAAAKELGNLSDQIHRTGSGLVRGGDTRKEPRTPPPELLPDEKKTVDFAKQVYRDMMKNTDPDDITPEIYLFSVLADFEQYPDMAELISAMKKKQPANTEIQTLAALVPESYRK